MKRLVVWMIVAVCGVAPAAQQRDARPTTSPSAAPAAPTGKASLSGRVVADASGAPVGLSTVVLVGSRTGVLRVAATAADGQFHFNNLPADRYTVGATKLPYLGAVAGARRAARPGTPIPVAEGETVTDVLVRLPMGGVLSGIVTDVNGAVIPGSSVTAFRRSMRNGEVTLQRVGAATTDDRGQYRLHSLPPGDYIVGALSTHQPMSVRRIAEGEVDDVLNGRATPIQAEVPQGAATTTYYPGTARMTDAVAISVGTGEEKRGLDFPLRSSSPGRVDGVVTMADGSALPPNVTVMASSVSGGAGFSAVSQARPTPDGRFTLANLAPSQWSMTARVSVAGNTYTAVGHVDVQGGDVHSMTLALRPSLTVGGRVAVPSAGAPSVAGLRLNLATLSNAQAGTAAPQLTPTQADGTFRITNLSDGRYHFSGAPFFGASTASIQWGVESITLDGTDITDRAFEVSGDRPPKEVVVTLTDRWQQISGRLLDDQNRGVSDFTVMAFPTDETLWLWQTRRIVTATPGTDGAYTLGGPGPAMLPAGEYYLAVVTDVSRDEQFDPAFLKTLIPSALRVTLEPGGKVVTDVKVK